MAKILGRVAVGFEENRCAYEIGYEKLSQITFGSKLKDMPDIINIKPSNQGKTLDYQEKLDICKKFAELIRIKTKKDAMTDICKEFGRGYFSIEKILKANKDLVLKFKKLRCVPEIDFS